MIRVGQLPPRGPRGSSEWLQPSRKEIAAYRRLLRKLFGESKAKRIER